MCSEEYTDRDRQAPNIEVILRLYIWVLVAGPRCYLPHLPFLRTVTTSPYFWFCFFLAGTASCWPHFSSHCCLAFWLSLPSCSLISLHQTLNPEVLHFTPPLRWLHTAALLLATGQAPLLSSICLVLLSRGGHQFYWHFVRFIDVFFPVPLFFLFVLTWSELFDLCHQIHPRVCCTATLLLPITLLY